jgi:hypothetical protein
MKPDEGPYLPTSCACAHVHPHAVPAVVLSPLRAALDRSRHSSPHLRLPHTSACSCSSLLKYPPFPSLPSTDPRCSSFHSLAPFPASTRFRERLRYTSHSAATAYPPALPLLQALCLSRGHRRRERQGRRVESAFHSWLAQRTGEVATEGRRGSGVSEAGERQVRYGEHRCTRLVSRPRPMRGR